MYVTVLHREQLRSVLESGELLLPEVGDTADQETEETLARLLRLALGIAVTCPARQSHLARLQRLPEPVQLSLSGCLASCLLWRDWAGQQGRISAQSDASSDPGTKSVSPPGEEIWAQKCHELDFQVSQKTLPV